MASKMVTINVPRGMEREDPNQVIAVNGVRYLVPRGKKTQVPAEIAEEFERSEKAKDAFNASRDRLIEEAGQK